MEKAAPTACSGHRGADLPSSLVLDSSSQTPRPVSVAADLSARELEVLKMASRGFTNSAIADQLTVSVHAVKWHLASVYRKLGVTNRTEAAVTYLRGNTNGL